MPLTDHDASHLAQLRATTHRALGQAIGPGADVALVDVPNQINVGDSLIWAGELAYLRALGSRIRYVSDLQGFDPHSLRRAMRSGIVLIHGGGNFGDLWLGHQGHREYLAQTLTDYRIVQLPQSVYFGSAERAAEANRILGAHPDFLLLARDGESMQRAAAILPDVDAAFCHDMAFGWDAPARGAAPTPRALVIARADKEAVSELHAVAADWLPGVRLEVTDWGAVSAGREKRSRAQARMRLQHRRADLTRRLPPLGRPGLQPVIRRTLSQINTTNIRAGVSLYDTASVVVTDRLHAHLIAALRGIPHVLLDNSYGKLRAIYESSSGSFSTAHRATSIDEARDLASQLARSV